jgi:hypothetical protein
MLTGGLDHFVVVIEVLHTDAALAWKTAWVVIHSYCLEAIDTSRWSPSRAIGSGEDRVGCTMVVWTLRRRWIVAIASQHCCNDAKWKKISTHDGSPGSN